MFPKWSHSLIAGVLLLCFVGTPTLVIAENNNKAATTKAALDATFTAIDIAVGVTLAVLDAKKKQKETQAETDAKTAQTSAVPIHDAAVFKLLQASNQSTGKTATETSKTQAKNKKDWAVYLYKTVLQSVAVALLNKVSEATVDWINRGFEGSPMYVENPEQFFKNTGETYLRNVVDTIGYNSTKYPYGRAVARTLVEGYLDETKTLEQKLQFTFDQTAGADLKRFPNSFSVGGWNSYEKYYGNTAANTFDFFFAALDYKERAVRKAQEEVQKQLEYGRGFMNQKICVAERAGPQLDPAGTGSAQIEADFESALEVNVGGQYNDSRYPGFDENAPEIPFPGTPTFGTSNGNGTNNTVQNGTYGTTYASTGTTPGTGIAGECLRYKTLSPGSVVEQQINRALVSTKFGQTELAAALGNSLSNIVNALSNLLASEGLKALSKATSGSPVSVNGNTVSWSYDGLTLGGNQNNPGSGNSTSTTNPNNIWEIPEDTIDLYELLITGPVLATTQTTDANGVITFVPSEFGDTVIETTQKELDVYQEAKTLLQGLPQKLFALDQCLPGPNRNWQSRLSTRLAEVQAQLGQILNPSGSTNAYAQRLRTYLTTISQGVDSFVTLRVNTYNIPGYATLNGQLSQSSNFDGKAAVYDERIADITTILNQLQSIATQVQTMGPAEDLTPEEAATLVTLVDQYSSIQTDIPSQATLTEATAERDQIKAVITAVDAALDTGNANSCPSVKSSAANQYHFSYVVTSKGARIGTIIPGVLSSSDQASLASGAGIPNLTSGETPQVGEAYDQAANYHVVRPPSIASVSLINQSQSQMISDLTNSPFNAGSTNLARLNALSQSDLEIVYSVIKGNGSGQYFPNVPDGPSLVTLGLDWFAMEQPATPVTVDETTEQMFYCQSILDNRDVQNLLKSWNVSISCNDFYESTLDDYL